MSKSLHTKHHKIKITIGVPYHIFVPQRTFQAISSTSPFYMLADVGWFNKLQIYFFTRFQWLDDLPNDNAFQSLLGAIYMALAPYRKRVNIRPKKADIWITTKMMLVWFFLNYIFLRLKLHCHVFQWCMYVRYGTHVYHKHSCIVAGLKSAKVVVWHVIHIDPVET